MQKILHKTNSKVSKNVIIAIVMIAVLSLGFFLGSTGAWFTSRDTADGTLSQTLTFGNVTYTITAETRTFNMGADTSDPNNILYYVVPGTYIETEFTLTNTSTVDSYYVIKDKTGISGGQFLYDKTPFETAIASLTNESYKTQLAKYNFVRVGSDGRFSATATSRSWGDYFDQRYSYGIPNSSPVAGIGSIIQPVKRGYTLKFKFKYLVKETATNGTAGTDIWLKQVWDYDEDSETPSPAYDAGTDYTVSTSLSYGGSISGLELFNQQYEVRAVQAQGFRIYSYPSSPRASDDALYYLMNDSNWTPPAQNP